MTEYVLTIKTDDRNTIMQIVELIELNGIKTTSIITEAMQAPAAATPVDCPACEGHGHIVTPFGTYDCPNTICPSKKADAKPGKDGA